MTVVHPKTAGAALLGTASVLIVAVLEQIGVHVQPTLTAAITGFAGTLGAYLFPNGEQAPVSPDPKELP